MAQILFEWDGEAMVPAPRFQAECDREYVIGYKYILEPITPAEQRSRASHGHYFALVNEAWQNLPETLSTQPWAASAEFLRHKALIETGHLEQTVYQCATNKEAVRWMGALPRPVSEDGEPVYHERSVSGTVLVQRAPRSQKYRRMKKAEFQKSKDDVLGFLSDLIGAEIRETAA